MKKPWKKDQDSAKPVEAEAAVAQENYANGDVTEQSQPTTKAYTPKKGRPTPKRNEVEREIGVRRSAFEAPATPAEARKRRKELKASMSKQEYKAMKQRQKDERARERRKINERMMAGDEAYLMERDKGKEKRFVRDWVDSRRYLMNMFLPLTLIVIVVMIFGMSNPALANMTSIFMMMIFLVMLSEGLWLGRRINREVNSRFPDNPHGSFSLGMYAFTRATMIRRLRTPAPQKQIGDEV